MLYRRGEEAMSDEKYAEVTVFCVHQVSCSNLSLLFCVHQTSCSDLSILLCVQVTVQAFLLFCVDVADSPHIYHLF